MIPVSLLEHLKSVLANDERLRASHERSLETCILRSKAHRSHALFPWATDAPDRKVQAHEVLILVAERHVPVYGLEAAIYTVASSSIALVYVSKVDTTGLNETKDAPSLAAALTVAFLSHALAHPPPGCTDVRIHIFARAQDQYLFPDSIKNVNKRRLTDKELCRWWKRVLDRVARQTSGPRLRLFYLLPGFDYGESLPFVPKEADGPAWAYGHPYDALRPCMGSEDDSKTLANLIPAFPDDPKARFLMSLTSSPLKPTGEAGDYDDAFSTAAGHSSASADLLAGIATERKRLQAAVPGGAEEFWVRMGARQECSDGHLAAFFVVAAEHEIKEVPNGRPAETTTLPSVERASYIRLWSELHNVDYSQPETVKMAFNTWRAGVEATCRNDAADLALVRGTTLLPIATGPTKRPSENALAAKPAVMTLQPRKKVKKV